MSAFSDTIGFHTVNFLMAIRKLGALIDLYQLQLTPGCHQEEKINILTHAKIKNILGVNGHVDVSMSLLKTQ